MLQPPQMPKCRPITTSLLSVRHLACNTLTASFVTGSAIAAWQQGTIENVIRELFADCTTHVAGCSEMDAAPDTCLFNLRCGIGKSIEVPCESWKERRTQRERVLVAK